MQWRLLDLPPLTAAENMALDEVLLEIRGSGRSQDTLRFLQFKPATVLVGFHQSIQEEIRLSYCREQGIDINRRITGGGGLLFDESQIGWEVICDKAFFGVGIPNANLFRRLCEPTVTALRGMPDVSSPQRLLQKCRELVAQGTQGVLLSGGCNGRGQVPWQDFTDTIAAIKQETGLYISVHCGMNILTQAFNQVFSNHPYNNELIKQLNDHIAPIGGQKTGIAYAQLCSDMSISGYNAALFALGLLLALPELVVEMAVLPPPTWNMPVLIGVVYSGVGCSFAAYLLWTRAIANVGPVLAGMGIPKVVLPCLPGPKRRAGVHRQG